MSKSANVNFFAPVADNVVNDDDDDDFDFDDDDDVDDFLCLCEEDDVRELVDLPLVDSFGALVVSLGLRRLLSFLSLSDNISISFCECGVNSDDVLVNEIAPVREDPSDLSSANFFSFFSSFLSNFTSANI